MSARIEVLVNGQRVCVAGVSGNGVLSACWTYVQHSESEREHGLNVTGLGLYSPEAKHPEHVAWPSSEVGVGDEITFRILEPGEFELPPGFVFTPVRCEDDPDFGRIKWSGWNAWDGNIPFDRPPFESVAVHIVAGESGPTAAQRNGFHEFAARYEELWPAIAAALVRCHEEIDTIEELTDRISPCLSLTIHRDPLKFDLKFTCEGDPEYRGYHIRLRNGVIAEVGSYN